MSDGNEKIERRSVRRYSTEIEVEWEGAVGRKKGTVSDISLLGCFVLCSGEVKNGEDVEVFFPIDDGMSAQFRAVVVNHVVEIGFGVKFCEINLPQKEFLETLINSLTK